MGDFDYWHWGPDEALDVTPPGYTSGKAYAEAFYFIFLSGYRRLAGRGGQWPGRMRFGRQLPPHLGFSVL